MNDRFILQALIFIVQLSVADPGRFISEDSYWGEDSNPLSLNLYTYVTNNPIMFVDPSGHSAATATYSQEYEDALREMAKGDDGNAIWAQNEIENKGWYKDENGSVYSKDEVLHALYPDWYSTPANITVGGEQIGNARVENGVSTGNLTDIAKGLGGSVQWNENTRTATLALGNQIVTYNLNDMVHGQGVASDGTMFRISNDNKLQVSVRDVATTANASGKDSSANQITWSVDSGTVNVTIKTASEDPTVTGADDLKRIADLYRAVPSIDPSPSNGISSKETSSNQSFNGSEGTGNNSQLGILSKKYESNGKPGTVSNGNGDLGGASYGAYQFASTFNVPLSFTKWLKDKDDDYYARLLSAYEKDGNKYGEKFNSTWKEIANENSNVFLQLQHDYTKEQYYDKTISKLKNDIGFDVDQHSFALKNVIWSRSVQHGATGGANVIINALSGLDIKSASEEEIIRTIYAESGSGSKNNLKYFGGNSAAVQASVWQRLNVDEPNEALKMLSKERN